MISWNFVLTLTPIFTLSGCGIIWTISGIELIVITIFTYIFPGATNILDWASTSHNQFIYFLIKHFILYIYIDTIKVITHKLVRENSSAWTCAGQFVAKPSNSPLVPDVQVLTTTIRSSSFLGLPTSLQSQNYFITHRSVIN